jgi:hypothetical protein
MHEPNTGLQRLRSVTRRIGMATAVLTGVSRRACGGQQFGHSKHIIGVQLH